MSLPELDESEPRAAKRQLKLDQDCDEFFAKGGQVTSVEIGKTGIIHRPLNIKQGFKIDPYKQESSNDPK